MGKAATGTLMQEAGADGLVPFLFPEAGSRAVGAARSCLAVLHIWGQRRGWGGTVAEEIVFDFRFHSINM